MYLPNVQPWQVCWTQGSPRPERRPRGTAYFERVVVVVVVVVVVGVVVAVVVVVVVAALLPCNISSTRLVGMRGAIE